MKKTVLIPVLFASLLAFNGCSEITNFSYDNVKEIKLLSGESGKAKTIEDKEIIDYISHNISNIPFSKQEEVNIQGFSYVLDYVDTDNNVISSLTLLGDGITIIYDNYLYVNNTNNLTIDLQYIDNLFL